MSATKQPEELAVASVIIKGNTFIYENEAIQINTLTAIWIDDLTASVKNILPTWVKVVATVGGLSVFLGVLSQEPIFLALGIVFASVAISRYSKYVPVTKKPKFALGIEKASGDTLRFTSGNKDAVVAAANAMFDAISDKEEQHTTIVMNPSMKVPVKKSIGSSFPLRKKQKPKAKLYAKKPTEKLVDNIDKLKPKTATAASDSTEKATHAEETTKLPTQDTTKKITEVPAKP